MVEVGLHTENIRLEEEDKTCLVKDNWRTCCDGGGGGVGGGTHGEERGSPVE